MEKHIVSNNLEVLVWVIWLLVLCLFFTFAFCLFTFAFAFSPVLLDFAMALA